MLHFPLLSVAYEAALLGPDELRPESAAPRQHRTPGPVPPEHTPSSFEDEDEGAADMTDGSSEDMETARTRPLRLARFPP